MFIGGVEGFWLCVQGTQGGHDNEHYRRRLRRNSKENQEGDQVFSRVDEYETFCMAG